MWHVPFRVIDDCGYQAAKFKIARKPYQVFPLVHVSKLTPVRMFTIRLMQRLRVSKADRVDSDEARLPEDSWVGVMAEDELEMERITDMQSE